MHTDLSIELRIDEDETNTLVFAELDLRGDHFEATGRARRNPIDRPMPVVGEELAVARALGALALEVMEAAQHKIERFLEPA
ncbi:MAG TPA: dsRBD fold-containing protein [Acidimicrobiia bacterium]|nr:dsRBD fold-containing protein [Acidimicrobiia bacterium]